MMFQYACYFFRGFFILFLYLQLYYFYRRQLYIQIENAYDLCSLYIKRSFNQYKRFRNISRQTGRSLEPCPHLNSIKTRILVEHVNSICDAKIAHVIYIS